MNSSIIPWKLFLDALRLQDPGQAQDWLRRWFFTNEGVIRVLDPVEVER